MINSGHCRFSRTVPFHRFGVSGFGFLFWCLFMGAIITKQYSSSNDLEEIQEEISIDQSIEEQIPEVPNQ